MDRDVINEVNRTFKLALDELYRWATFNPAPARAYNVDYFAQQVQGHHRHPVNVVSELADWIRHNDVLQHLDDGQIAEGNRVAGEWADWFEREANNVVRGYNPKLKKSIDDDIKSLRSRYKGLDLNRMADMIRRGDYGVLADYLQDEGNATADVNENRIRRAVEAVRNDLSVVIDGEPRRVRVGDYVDCNFIWSFVGTVIMVSRVGGNYYRIHLTGGESYDLPDDAQLTIIRPPTPTTIADHIRHLGE